MRDKERVLLISVTPFWRSYAILNHLARELKKTCIVDALDVYADVGANSPQYPWRDRLYDALSFKFERLVAPYINGRVVKLKPDKSCPIPRIPDNVADLRDYTFLGARVGLAALSTAASVTKINERECTDRYGNALKRTWRVAHEAALVADKLRKSSEYKAVYIFNGRHAVSRPFCDIFSGHSRVIRYESGGGRNRFVLSSVDIHSAAGIADRIKSYKADHEVGAKYFQDRVERAHGTDSARFTFNQTRGGLPRALRDKTFVVMYTSSEDEFFAVSDSASFGDFENQSAVALAAAVTCKELGILLVIRMHPHLRFKPYDWRESWPLSQLRGLGAVVLPPDDSTDSYALIEPATGILSCGSSITIEAAYAGTPTAVVGDHFLFPLGVSNSIQNKSDLRRFILSPTAPDGACSNAIKWASFQQIGGETISSLENFQRLETAVVEGKVIEPVRKFVLRIKRAAFQH